MIVMDFVNRKITEQRLKRLRSPEDFQIIVSREQQFSRRAESDASLIIFETGPSRLSVTDTGLLVDTIRSNIRTTDVVGWYDHGRIGVLLPDTPKDGAQRVLDGINDRIRKQSSIVSLPPVVIHTYSGGRDNSGNGNGRHASTSETTAIQSR